MCGLFGAIGKDIDPGTIRALALANLERGVEGLGFFDSNGTIAKSGGDAVDVLGCDENVRAIVRPADRWFLCGHTRWSTRGSNSDANAHPFQYGRVIGSHNGVVSAPSSYTVDSEFLFDLLEFHNGDYQAALEKVVGSFALTWSYDEALYLLTHRNPLVLAVVGNSVYYSSDANHLDACVDVDSLHPMEDGAVLKFTFDEGGPKLEALPAFESKTTGFFTANWNEKKDGQTNTGDGQGWPESGNEREQEAEDLLPRQEGEGDEEYWSGHDKFISDIEEYNAKAKGQGYRNLDDLMEWNGMVTLDQAINFIDETERYTRLRLTEPCQD